MSHRFVFVGGLHRSGASLLTKLIAQHPDVSGMFNTGARKDEGQYLQDIWPCDSDLGGAGRFAFDHRAHRQAQEQSATVSHMRDRLLRSWGPHWDMARPVLVEKSPSNCLASRHLQSIFEDSAFVFITRHPIANALATREWCQTSLFALIEHWLHAHSLMRQDIPHLRRIAWVSYENLITAPIETLRCIFEILGLSPYRIDLRTVTDPNKPYMDIWQHSYLQRLHPADGIRDRMPDNRKPAPAPSMLRRIRENMGRRMGRKLLSLGLDLVKTEPETEAILACLEDRVRSFGYSLTELGMQPATETFLDSHRLLNPTFFREQVIREVF